MLTTRSFVTEDLGGGTQALVLTLESGPVLVLTDGNTGTDLGAYDESGDYGTALLFASLGDWQDSGHEPVLEHNGPAAEILAVASYWAGQ